jgi:hypothetical protein
MHFLQEASLVAVSVKKAKRKRHYYGKEGARQNQRNFPYLKIATITSTKE